MINSIVYNIKEGLKGISRNRTMAAASISSVAASLFIVGIIFSIVLNINNFAILAQKQFDTVQVFLKDDMNAKEIYDLKTKIEKMDGVSKVALETKEDALNKLKSRWGKDAYLLEGIDNPLQNSFIVDLSNIENANTVVSALKDFDKIDDVKYYRDIVSKLIKISNLIKSFGIFMIVLLSILSLVIISNTIKLALHARRREINIMKYIGATDWFIRWPFVIEGMTLGLLGALMSITVVYFMYRYFYEKVSVPASSILSGYVLPVASVTNELFLMFIVMGVGVGIIGSLISLRKYLKV